MHHMDLYRLAGDVGDAYVLDLDRTLAECCCLVEWPDRLEKEPAAALGVEIRLDGACRRVTVDAVSLSEDHTRGARRRRSFCARARRCSARRTMRSDGVRSSASIAYRGRCPFCNDVCVVLFGSLEQGAFV